MTDREEQIIKAIWCTSTKSKKLKQPVALKHWLKLNTGNLKKTSGIS